MMPLHRKVFEAAKEDAEYNSDVRAMGEKMPISFFADELETGVWGASYLGWLCGKY